MSLEEIINNCKENDNKAQELLFKRYARLMMAVCIRYVKQFEDSEEIMLTGFHKFFKEIHSFKFNDENSMIGYIKTIMINECLMFLRKQKDIRIVNCIEAENISNENDSLQKMSANEILNLMLQLPQGYRTIFNLYAIDGYTHKEIALLLNISDGTSKSQLSKARSLLQKMIKNNG